MDRSQLESTFDQQAATYDQQWAKLAAFRDGLHLLISSLFSKLPQDARVLCVGAGTGAEIDFLASKYPSWTFVAVEPAAGMVKAAELRAEQHGYRDRSTPATSNPCQPRLPLTPRRRCSSRSSFSTAASAPPSSGRSQRGLNQVAGSSARIWLPIVTQRPTLVCWKSGYGRWRLQSFRRSDFNRYVRRMTAMSPSCRQRPSKPSSPPEVLKNRCGSIKLA
jgi:hypothetical protein